MPGPTLLIGGMGFIGLHTARSFLDAGQDVVLTYHQNRREPDFLKADIGKRAKVEQLDVLDAARVAEVIKTHNVEGVVHLAVPALAGVSPADEFQTNTQGYLNVLEASRAAGVRRPERRQLGGYLQQRVRATVARRRDRLDRVDQPDRGVQESPRSARAVLRPAHRDGRGHAARGGHLRSAVPLDVQPAQPSGTSPRRTTTRPTSAACAPARPKPTTAATCVTSRTVALGIQMVHMADKLEHRIYNIGTGKVTRNAELVGYIQRIQPDFKADLAPGGDATNRYMDLTRTTAEVGYTPRIGVENGLAEYVDWLKTHDR